LRKRLTDGNLESFVDVLIRCNNASLRALEKWGWMNDPDQNATNKIVGLAGETVVVDFLQMKKLLIHQRSSPDGRFQGFKPQKIGEAFLSETIKIGGWDDDKSIDILYEVRLTGKNMGIAMEFNSADGRQVNKGRGENFTTNTNFVIEVKTGSTIGNFKKGFIQALDKSKGVPNSVPVVAIDYDAYMDAIEKSPSLKAAATDYTKKGGRLMLLGGLNRQAKIIASQAKEIVKEGVNPNELPTGH
jgi:hypothetical protein